MTSKSIRGGPMLPLLLFLLMMIPSLLRAQGEPIVVTLTVLPPYPPDLTIWESNPDKVLINLRNTTGQSFEVRLSGFAENLNGSVRIVTKDSYPRNRITVGPNAVVTLNMRDLQLFTGDAVDVIGTEKNTIARTKELPEGSYRMCVRALEYTSLDPLSAQQPSGCASFSIRFADPPRPLMPACGTTVRATKPQLVTFQWSVPAGAPAATQYEFEMAEVPKGWDPNDAIAAKTSPLFFSRTVNAPLLSYGPAEPALRSGIRYAWRVRAIDPTRATTFRNEGYSEVCSFIYGEQVKIFDDTEGKEIITYDLPFSDTGTTPIITTNLEGGGIRARDLRGLTDFVLPACLTLTPVVDKRPLLTTTPATPPRFAVTVDPAIDPDAITGGTLEIWEEDGRRDLLTSNRFFNESKKRAVFTSTFTGNGGKVLRHTRTGNRSTLELMNVNRDGAGETFTPERGKSYRWRVTLRFDGREIRDDGVTCNLNEATSPFARLPDFTIPEPRPDTLMAAGFAIVVEQWDASSLSEDASKPSGIGRIRFDCDAGVSVGTIIPWGPADLTLKPYDFKVVDLIADSAAELSVPEARVIRESARTGDRMTLLLPDRTAAMGDGSVIPAEAMGDGSVMPTVMMGDGSVLPASLRDDLLLDRNLLLDLFGSNSPEGIRVAFRDVKWDGPVLPKVILTEGIAVYPSPTPLPVPPAELNLENGFILEIDSLTITTAKGEVEGSLRLPPSIITTDTCTFARLPLPRTQITPTCDFYREVADSAFGRWAIGETGLEIDGEGYVLDFSASQSPVGPSPALSNLWKGVVLREGQTPTATGEIISNRGYVKATYAFSNATVVGAGLSGRFTQGGTFAFTALDPYGYLVNVTNGRLDLVASAIDTGVFGSSTIAMPVNAVRRTLTSNSAVSVSYVNLYVQSDMDLFAAVKVSESLAWGEMVRESGDPRFYDLSTATDSGYFWLGSHWVDDVYYPINDTTFVSPALGMPATGLEAQGMQGVTFMGLRNRSFTIRTTDVPNVNAPIVFQPEIVAIPWMNVGRGGVHTEVALRPTATNPGVLEVGPTWSPHYQADSTPFKIIFADASLPTHTTTHVPNRKAMYLRFVESAVFSSSLSGGAMLEGPIGMPVLFENMMFTSIANNAGGNVHFGNDDTLDYWGLEVVEKDSGKAGGIMAVKQGVIYLTASGLNEGVHFDTPFWLVWGEMQASGNFGQLFFDYNNVGQKFDGFGYAVEHLALSPWIPGDSGYVQTYGSVSIPFFGSKMMSISDYKGTVADTPYSGRFVRSLAAPHLGAGASDVHWDRNWADSLVTMEWNIGYDTVEQNGFLGVGDVDVRMIGSSVDGTLRVTSESSCFRLMASTQRGFDLGPVASAGHISELWGCGCIVDGNLRQVAVGGYLSDNAGSTILQARTATAVTMTFSFTPDRMVFFANGQMFINVMGNDVDAFGLTHFTVDWSEGFAEGYFKGTLSLGSFVGIPVAASASSGISGFGEFDWHAGLDYQSIQGRVGVAMYGMVSGIGASVGAGVGIETGVFLGINAPKEKAWVMNGINGRFGLNKGGLPDRLTGFYAYLGLRMGVDLFIVSGGYEIYVGIGAFAPTLDVPTGGVFGNFGIYIWGKILGGLVSAAAWGNLQIGVAIPPSFHGAVGLEACVLWIFCGSVQVAVGFNQEDGFYMY